jgi:hypothetical protein
MRCVRLRPSGRRADALHDERRRTCRVRATPPPLPPPPPHTRTGRTARTARTARTTRTARAAPRTACTAAAHAMRSVCGVCSTAESNFESADGYSVLTWAPAPAGGARLEYQLQRDSSIVCFVSGRADGAGYHSLLPTGGTSYSVPPLAQLTLESVEAPGTWQAPCAGKHINQTCYTFSLSYL